MNYQYIQYNIEKNVAVITLNRPEKLNAYTPDMGEELVHSIRQAMENDTVKVVVLTAQGRGFCAGADRDYLKGKAGACGFRLGEESFIKNFAAELATAQKPLIAAVNGVASGIGVTMTLPFDIRLASTEARFDFPFVKLGVTPGFASSYFLPRLIGEANASDVLLNSRTLTAEYALAMGLVSQVLPVENLLPEAIAMAQRMAQAPPKIIALCKDMLMASRTNSVEECMQRERVAAEIIARTRQ